ncbi:unnamed protein product [Rhizophagus irregularis]|nr:unnamed protein product [Rhizophagus irregularis]
MTRPSKRKTKIREQERDNCGKFAKKPRVVDDWGDDDDSGWDDELDVLNEKEDKYELVWSDNAHLERKQRGPSLLKMANFLKYFYRPRYNGFQNNCAIIFYLAGKTKKSTYFDKYGPSGCFTKAAKGSAKITKFINKHRSTPEDFEEVLDNMEDEEQNHLDLNKRIENLRIELKKQQSSLNVTEYNKKRAIFKYLRRLSDNDGKGKIKASVEAAQVVFIENTQYKARIIRYWAKYWLQHNHLPISRQGKHQKTIRLIDDEDIAEECHIWIRSQGGTTTPLKFKEFVEQKLLVNLGIMKKKTISVATATCWLNILGTYYDGHERPDVVKYRKSFLDEIYDYEKFMVKYEGENMERIPPTLGSNDKEIVVV